MATGRSNQLTKQIGEYLVACEIARRGLIATTFSGNVPDFDLIVTDFKGSSCPIQVKTSKNGTWQFSIDKFVEITFEGMKQIIGNKKPLQIPHLICVFVVAGKKYGEDIFFILEWSKVQEILISIYRRWLDSCGGVRPRKYDSMHCALCQSDLEEYKDNWSLIYTKL
ncbi:MAG: hypothetical protein QMD80_06960 [archaeon]|jgi:hypothetical protein|nr:hypothetical protein [archaeon]